MNSSARVSRVHGPGDPPDHASIRDWTTLSGRLNCATGQSFDRSRTNARHSGAAAVRDVAGFFDFGFEWSLLPIQIPTARPGTPSLPGGRKPYVARSRASFAVPVLTAAGRRVFLGVFVSIVFSAQIGFWRGSVLPARMSVTR
jgi:hypothetical protein